MTASRSQTVRQSLHLHIDPAPHDIKQLPSNSPASSPASSAQSGFATNGTIDTPTTGTSLGWLVFPVLCMYDFHSNDPDQLAFSKNEILDVVKQEDSGWWAAMRRGGTTIGWIPAAFVVSLTEEMSEKLRNTREELRIAEYTAEELYNTTVTAPSLLYDSEPELSPAPTIGRYAYRTRDGYSSILHSNNPQVESPAPMQQVGQQPWPYHPPSPSTPMPQPPPLYVDKPTPPTPNESDEISPRDRRRQGLRIDEPPRTTARVPTLPNFLKPKYTDQLEVDGEGHVRYGTLVALVERLASDPLSKDPTRMADDTTFRNIFLMTFRTFTSADKLFDMLVGRYQLPRPENITEAEFGEWKEKCLLPTQRRVLTVFTMWLEDHRLLEEEPYIAQRLTDFLASIVTPAPLAVTAKLIIQSVERLTFAHPSQQPGIQPRRRRKSKAHKNDLLKLDPADVAEQLALLEYKMYVKIAPQECIAYAKSQVNSPAVANLCAFCATHDKLAAWVKTSILDNEALGRRADTVDFWIKVAEKCKNIHNFASMSALINALSSAVISRLHLTWAHVGRKSNLDNLLKYNEPTGGFSGYRSLLSNVEGSCVPFVGMFLTDICHIRDQFQDEGERICFLRRQRWYEAVSAMLRYQSRPYNIAESESTTNFITTHLQLGSLRDQAWFWTRSQEVQQSELAHADIRKGLVQAGF